jgi:hypothetical protein
MLNHECEHQPNGVHHGGGGGMHDQHRDRDLDEVIYYIIKLTYSDMPWHDLHINDIREGLCACLCDILYIDATARSQSRYTSLSSLNCITLAVIGSS